MRRKQFEYKTFNATDTMFPEYDEILNNFGSEGWELAGIETGKDIVFYVFKREKIDV